MILTNAQKVGASALFVTLAIGVAYKTLSTGPEASAGHIRIVQDGGAPAGSVGVWVTALGDAKVMAQFGVDAGGQSYAYFRAKVCAQPSDAGTLSDGGEAAVDPGPYVLPGLVIIYNDPNTTFCDAGEPEFEGWAQGRADAPFQCACAVDATCLVLGDAGSVAAPLGQTLQPGWSGAGCLPKSCIVIAGHDVWPAQCPIPPSAPIPAFDPSTHYPDGGGFLYGPDGGLL